MGIIPAYVNQDGPLEKERVARQRIKGGGLGHDRVKSYVGVSSMSRSTRTWVFLPFTRQMVRVQCLVELLLFVLPILPHASNLEAFQVPFR